MTALLLLGTALAGGVGAALRLLADTWVKGRVDSAYGPGTWLVNLTGSLALGLVTGLVARGGLPDAWRHVLGTGLCGGWTTFSTASLDTARLATTHGGGPALLHAVGMLVGSVLAAALGLWLVG